MRKAWISLLGALLLAAGLASRPPLAKAAARRQRDPHHAHRHHAQDHHAERRHAAARGHRQALLGHGGRLFVPLTGDWEGEVDGLPASFQIVYKPGLAALYHRSPYGVANLLMFLPTACPVSPIAYQEETIAEAPDLAMLEADGRYGLTKTENVYGGLTGPHTAILSQPLDLYGLLEADRCPTKLTWKMHPAERQPVSDGTWSLAFADGESATFIVSAGGRLARDIPLPAGLGTESCPGPSGGVDLFVHPNRTASQTDSRLGMAVNVKFTSRSTAVGQFSLAAQGSSCPARTLTLTAHLSH